jgi:hypothetical protein
MHRRFERLFHGFANDRRLCRNYRRGGLRRRLDGWRFYWWVPGRRYRGGLGWFLHWLGRSRNGHRHGLCRRWRNFRGSAGQRRALVFQLLLLNFIKAPGQVRNLFDQLVGIPAAAFFHRTGVEENTNCNQKRKDVHGMSFA